MHAKNLTILRKSVTVGALVFACLALGACRHGPAKCAKPGVYAQAESIAPLKIPSGLQAPDTRGALRIPELNEPEAPLPAGANCIDQPPRYAPNARLTAPESDKKTRKRGKNQPAAAPAPAPPAPAPAPPPASR